MVGVRNFAACGTPDLEIKLGFLWGANLYRYISQPQRVSRADDRFFALHHGRLVIDVNGVGAAQIPDDKIAFFGVNLCVLARNCLMLDNNIAIAPASKRKHLLGFERVFDGLPLDLPGNHDFVHTTYYTTLELTQIGKK